MNKTKLIEKQGNVATLVLKLKQKHERMWSRVENKVDDLTFNYKWELSMGLQTKSHNIKEWFLNEGECCDLNLSA
jgi:hypothetical protein